MNTRSDGAFWVAITLLLGAGALAAADDEPKQKPPKYVTFGRLPGPWQLAVTAHGSRVRKPGKERLTLNGSIKRGTAAPVAFTMIQELPVSIRYMEQGSPTVVFDGVQYKRGSVSVRKSDTDLVETLAYDTPERFLLAPDTGLKYRILGFYFRPETPRGATYTGPLEDVIMISDSIPKPGNTKRQTKYYHLDSYAHTLSRVRYLDTEGAGTVEVVFAGWMRVEDNFVPRTIQRLENGSEVLRFSISSAAFGQAVLDAAFQDAVN